MKVFGVYDRLYYWSQNSQYTPPQEKLTFSSDIYLVWPYDLIWSMELEDIGHSLDLI